MTLLDDDLRVDGGPRVGVVCPHEGCDWRFLQEHALEAHVAVQHGDGAAFRADPEPPEEVVAGD